MSGSRNRFSQIKQTRQPRKGHAKRIPGDLEDAGKWFHCRICGFPCKIGRNALGEGEGHVNLAFIEGTQLDITDAILLDFRDAITLAEGDVTRYEPTTNGGCPLCGSLNWL